MSTLLITIGRLRTDGADALQQYAEGVVPVIMAQGGQVVSRGIPQETVVGGDEGRPDLVAVIRFPTAEAIRRFLSSPEYRANLPHSDRAFAEVRSYIAADLME
jgi:uncharacterized protein (DUF1330 family)